SDGRIIIYVLDIQKSPFERIVPLVSSNIDEVLSLKFHTANLLGKYMIVAFGNITQSNAPPLGKSSKIYLLDISSYTWVKNFEPVYITLNETKAKSTTTSAKSTTLSNISESNFSKVKIVIGIISGIACFTIFSAVGLFSYKWYQKRKHVDVIRISGNI
ncbi:8845_t:CDS:2, partial [Funneliformis geosporum]